MTAYLSYLAGDVFGLSGILALFVCAVAISHYALNIISGGCWAAAGGISHGRSHCRCCTPFVSADGCLLRRLPLPAHITCTPLTSACCPARSSCSGVAHHHHLRLPHPQLCVGGRHLCVLRPGCPGPAQVAGGLGQGGRTDVRRCQGHGFAPQEAGALARWCRRRRVLQGQKPFYKHALCRTPMLARWPGCSGSCSSCSWSPAPLLW